MLRWSLTRPSMWLLAAPPGLASALSTAVGVRKDASRYGPDASCTTRQGGKHSRFRQDQGGWLRDRA